jgi:ATP:ADP antiporter, AAA family
LRGIGAAFDIKKEERLAVAVLLLLSFAVGAAIVFAETGATVLFLDRYGAQRLPQVYLVSAGVIASAGFLFSRIEEKTSIRFTLAGTLTLLFLSAATFRSSLAASSAPWVPFVLLVWFRLLYVLSGLVLWGMAGRLFNLRQGKRLFGLVGTGEVIASILGYFSIPIFVRLWGAPNLITLAAVALGIGLSSVAFASSRFSDRLGNPRRAQGRAITGKRLVNRQAGVPGQADQRNAPRPTGRKRQESRYTALIFLVSLLVVLAYFFLDFSMAIESKARFPDPDRLAGFFGIFYGLVCLGRLAARVFLSRWILKRFGLSAGLLILPVSVILGAAAIFLAGEFQPGFSALFFFVAGTRFLESTLRPAIHKTSFLLLYQPLSSEHRLAVQSRAETLVEPIGMAVAGAILLFFNTYSQPPVHHLAAILLATAGIWLGSTVFLYRDYIAALKNALAKKVLGDASVSLEDATTIQTLSEKVGSQNPGEVIFALELLEIVDPALVENKLPELVVHPAEEVRLAAVIRIDKRKMAEALPLVRRQFQIETKPELSAAMLWTLITLCQASDPVQLVPLLENPEPSIQAEAIIGLLKSDRPLEVSAAETKLKALASSPDPNLRAVAATISGRAKQETCFPLVKNLLVDESPAVRRAALQAAGRLSLPALWPVMISCLAQPNVRRAAAKALIESGPGVIPALYGAFQKKDLDQATLRSLVRVAGSIRGKEAVDFLEKELVHPDPKVRLEVLKSLNHCGYRAEGAYPARIRQQVVEETGLAAWLAGLLHRTGPAQASLQNALLAQIDLRIEGIFYYLSFLYDPGPVLLALDRLRQRQPEKQAFAMEMLDVLIPKELNAALLPVLEGFPYRQGKALVSESPQSYPKDGNPAEILLRAENGKVDPWTRACAIYSLEPPLEEQVEPAIRAMLADPNPLVREAASWMLAEESWKEGVRMLTTLEKVIILKTVSIFSEAPDNLLAEIAGLVNVVDVDPGQRIFTKGEEGTRMYVIVEGQVQVHDGEQTLDLLGDREVFGEMALLDSEPRTASATAITGVRLLELDQEPFYELLEEQFEITRGIIGVLVRRLRERSGELVTLRKSSSA